jgi:hypothetical protein
MRGVDTCGFIDVGAAARVGTPSYFGAGGEYEQCDVEYSPPAGPLRIYEVSVGFVTADGNQGTSVEGTPIRFKATPELCTSYIPFDLNNRHLYLAYTVFAKSDTFEANPSGLREELCPTAVDFAGSAIPLAATRPQRAAAPPFTEQPTFPAHAQVNHPLASLDPCTAVSVLAAEQPLQYFNPSEFGWSCHLQFDPTNHANVHHISYTYGSLLEALEPLRYDDNSTRLTVAGHPAVETRAGQYDSSKYCNIHDTTAARNEGT